MYVVEISNLTLIPRFSFIPVLDDHLFVLSPDLSQHLTDVRRNIVDLNVVSLLPYLRLQFLYFLFNQKYVF